MKGVLLAWSGGKDSAMALRWLLEAELPVVGTFTTVDEADGSVPYHGVPAEALADQARALPCPHRTIPLPVPTTNAIYEERVGAALRALAEEFHASHVAFGDLFLEDVRAYRETLCARAGLTALFPLWGADTTKLSREIIAKLDVTIAAVDEARLDAALVGRRYNASFVAELPAGVDPCGERGEFHTLVSGFCIRAKS